MQSQDYAKLEDANPQDANVEMIKMALNLNESDVESIVSSNEGSGSEDERDLVKALAQRATDPFIKTRKAKGPFVYIKPRLRPGKHVYVNEEIERTKDAYAEHQLRQRLKGAQYRITGLVKFDKHGQAKGFEVEEVAAAISSAVRAVLQEEREAHGMPQAQPNQEQLDADFANKIAERAAWADPVYEEAVMAAQFRARQAVADNSIHSSMPPVSTSAQPPQSSPGWGMHHAQNPQQQYQYIQQGTPQILSLEGPPNTASMPGLLLPSLHPSPPISPSHYPQQHPAPVYTHSTPGSPAQDHQDSASGPALSHPSSLYAHPQQYDPASGPAPSFPATSYVQQQQQQQCSANPYVVPGGQYTPHAVHGHAASSPSCPSVQQRNPGSADPYTNKEPVVSHPYPEQYQLDLSEGRKWGTHVRGEYERTQTDKRLVPTGFEKSAGEALVRSGGREGGYDRHDRHRPSKADGKLGEGSDEEHRRRRRQEDHQQHHSRSRRRHEDRMGDKRWSRGAEVGTHRSSGHHHDSYAGHHHNSRRHKDVEEMEGEREKQRERRSRRHHESRRRKAERSEDLRDGRHHSHRRSRCPAAERHRSCMHPAEAASREQRHSSRRQAAADPEDRQKMRPDRPETKAPGIQQQKQQQALPPTAASKATSKKGKKAPVSDTDSQASEDSGFPGLEAVLASEEAAPYLRPAVSSASEDSEPDPDAPPRKAEHVKANLHRDPKARQMREAHKERWTSSDDENLSSRAKPFQGTAPPSTQQQWKEQQQEKPSSTPSVSPTTKSAVAENSEVETRPFRESEELGQQAAQAPCTTTGMQQASRSSGSKNSNGTLKVPQIEKCGAVSPGMKSAKQVPDEVKGDSSWLTASLPPTPPIHRVSKQEN